MPPRARARRGLPLDELFAHSDAVNHPAPAADEAPNFDDDEDEDQGDEGQGDEGQGDEGQGDEDREPSRLAVAGYGITHDGAGLILALLAYPLAVNLIRGGPAQMWGWVKAKYLNQPYTGGSGAQQNTPAPPPAPKLTPPSQLPPPSSRTAPTPSTTRSA